MCLDKYLKEKNTKCDSPPAPTIFFFFKLGVLGVLVFFLLFSKSLPAPNKQTLDCSKA